MDCCKKNENEKCKSKIKCIHVPVTYVCAIGALVRYWLIFSKYQKLIANHIEVSTPINSWKRILEGLYLLDKGINSYEGDLIHETPLALLFYKAIIRNIGLPAGYIFILCDVITAIALFLSAKIYMSKIFFGQETNKHKFAEDCEDYLLKGIDLRKAPTYVAATFLFNPYTLYNCVGFATTVFHNLLLSVFLYCMLSNNIVLSSLVLAICTSNNFYTFILVVPMWLHFSNYNKSKFTSAKAVLLFTTFLTMLTYWNHHLDKSNLFFKNIYGFILTTADLKPNIGLFWYFFTEMFDHFRELFICSFQINATILYLFPLALKFRKDIFILTTALLYLIAVFKSYPCVGDIGFVLSLLPCYRHFFTYSQQSFLVVILIVITSYLGPIVWYLWIYSNSANANFYFGVTLAFAVAQIFLVTDILFAYVKREFILYHGKERKIAEKEAVLILE